VYVRGSNAGVEYKRHDNSFYKGTVVQTNDPEMLMRVKVYIPEISNEPLDNWLNTNKQKATKMPGVNNITDAWSDTAIFHEIKDLLPWAEPCLPLMGECGPGRFWAGIKKGISNIDDGDYPEEGLRNNKRPINETDGVTSPALVQELSGNQQGDAFSEPTKTSTVFNNPHSKDYGSIKYPNASKGVFGVPNVGAQVWVFHYNGDLNFPVYFGARAGFGDVAPIMGAKQGAFGSPPVSQDYPGNSENEPYKVEDVPPLPPGERGTGEVIESTSGKIRNKPINGNLKNLFSKAGAEANVTVVVTSGGQPSSGSNRTGSHRHDHGMAADFMIKDNVSGKYVPISNSSKWSQFAQAFKRAATAGGYTTSGGAGQGYMGSKTAHFDIAAGRNPGVRQAIWPRSGRPGWVSILTN
tara:strand:- start:2081 stop:3307 length:1227 start_codon:yes stop_codon:yes gene_type:complete